MIRQSATDGGPEFRRSVSRDGSSIAYVVLGDGAPLAVATSWTTTVELQLKSAYSAAFLNRLKSHRRIVMPDRRGVGASQRDVSDLTLAAQVDDLESILDDAGIDECDLLGDNDGCYVAVAFAARYPHGVGRMALWAPLVTGQDARPQQTLQFAQLVLADWAAARTQWASYRARDRSEEQLRKIADEFAAMISPETAAAYLEWEASEDIAPLLPDIAVPTLVINTRRGRARSLGVVELMPHARFESLESGPDIGPPDAAHAAEVILRFLESDDVP